MIEIEAKFFMGDIVAYLMKNKIIRGKTVNGGKQTMNYWMRSGKLRLKRLTHNNYFFATVDELPKIKEAFSFGGKGYYFYDE